MSSCAGVVRGTGCTHAVASHMAIHSTALTSGLWGWLLRSTCAVSPIRNEICVWQVVHGWCVRTMHVCLRGPPPVPWGGSLVYVV